MNSHYTTGNNYSTLLLSRITGKEREGISNYFILSYNDMRANEPRARKTLAITGLFPCHLLNVFFFFFKFY